MILDWFDKRGRDLDWNSIAFMQKYSELISLRKISEYIGLAINKNR